MERLKPHYILIISGILLSLFATAHETFGKFNDWEVAPHQVFGILKLDDTRGRSYCNITAVDENTVKIEQISAQGILTETDLAYFVNGTLSRVTQANQWGDVARYIEYSALGNDEFMVTSMEWGKNEYLPARAAKYTYVNDQLVEVKYISFDGSICNGPEGVAIEKYKRYEDDPRITLKKEATYYDEEGNPAFNRVKDCHKEIFERDERGNETLHAYFDEKGRPVANRLGVYQTAGTYDALDNEIQQRNLDAAGKIAPDVHGVSITKYEYKNGVKLKTTFCNAAGAAVKSVNGGSGVAIIKYDYDLAGNQIKESYFDPLGRAMNNTLGRQSVTSEYSPSNMQLTKEYFDKSGKPVCDGENIHLYKYEYNDLGRKIQEAFYDNDYVPVKDMYNHVFMIKYDWNSVGRSIAESYWKTETVKMPRWDNYHEVRSKFNNQGQLTESDMYDEKGAPTTGSAGDSKIIQIYNQYSQLSELLCYNGDKPVMITDGTVLKYHSVRISYDKKNRVALLEYFNTLGKPTNAHFTIDGDFYASKIEIVYSGDQIIKEKIYALGNSAPYKIIDCIKNDYVDINGTTTVDVAPEYDSDAH